MSQNSEEYFQGTSEEESTPKPKRPSAMRRDIIAIRRNSTWIAWTLVTFTLSGMIAGAHFAGKLAALGERYSYSADKVYWDTVVAAIFIYGAIGAIAYFLVTLSSDN